MAALEMRLKHDVATSFLQASSFSAGSGKGDLSARPWPYELTCVPVAKAIAGFGRLTSG